MKSKSQVEIIITEHQRDYILSTFNLSSRVKDQIFSASKVHPQSSKYKLNLVTEDVDELRDTFMDRLQIHGFDEDYQLTEEGQMLEDLIDRFFVG
jgi:hypothetical protein